MKIVTKDQTTVYVLTADQMLQLDELISSLQAVYCDIFSNRELSVEGILNTTPRIALLSAVIKDQYNFTDI